VLRGKEEEEERRRRAKNALALLFFCHSGKLPLVSFLSTSLTSGGPGLNACCQCTAYFLLGGGGGKRREAFLEAALSCWMEHIPQEEVLLGAFLEAAKPRRACFACLAHTPSSLPRSPAAVYA